MSFVSLEDGPLRIHRSLARLLAMIGTLLAVLAVTLAAVGIYGVMAFLVSQRVKEIGIRVALGATSAEVLKAVVFQGLRPVLIGIAFGIAGAAGLSWLLHTSLSFPGASDLLYGIPFYDPPTFLGLSLMLLSIAASASVVPARRALSVDPDGAFEDELAFELAALAEQRVQLGAARGGGKWSHVRGSGAGHLGGSSVLYHCRFGPLLEGSSSIQQAAGQLYLNAATAASTRSSNASPVMKPDASGML